MPTSDLVVGLLIACMDDTSPTDRSARGDQLTVLVVDDERGLADLYAAWLSRNYETRVAYGGEEAIEILDSDIDIALLDRRMPKPSGDDVLKEIQDRGIDCATAMVTAVEPDFDIIEMGFDDYLTKPVSQDQLLELVDRLAKFREYDTTVSELFTLMNKKSLLEIQKSQTELGRNEAYQQLIERIEEVKREADTALSDLQAKDSEGTFFRYITDNSGESNV